MRIIFLSLSLSASVSAVAVVNTPGNIAELLESTLTQSTTNVWFEITGHITAPIFHQDFVLSDTTGRIPVWNASGTPYRIGDIARVAGVHEVDSNGKPRFRANALSVVGHKDAPPPADASIRDILAGRFDYCIVRTQGVVIDTIPDEIDRGFTYLLLRSEGRTLTAVVHRQAEPIWNLDKLRYSTISVTGTCNPTTGDFRKFHRYGITTHPNDIKILRAASTISFDGKPIDEFASKSPDQLAESNERACADGTVLATWRGSRFLLLRANGETMQVSLARGNNLPAIGQSVHVMGFPETDLFSLNLSSAVWREAKSAVAPPLSPERVTPEQLLTNKQGEQQYNPHFHGQLVTIRGTVRNTPEQVCGEMIMYLENGRFIIPVDATAFPEAIAGVSRGSEVEVTGICLMEMENWRPIVPFPRIRGITVILQSPMGIRILSQPPWWTTQRLLAVIVSLLVILATVAVWNRILRKLVERRGRQLFKAQIAQTISELKVDERARLAVELHDSISQNLTGASMQIDAAVRQLDLDRDKTAKFLSIASMTLDSCREELRNCIWDLRNQTLDEPDMNAAIRGTVERHLGTARLSTRFNLPRAKLSDNTTNAILCIIRELATNAVRHGRASEVKVAGGLDNGKLMFSVRDNGIGFDPQTAPGMTQGHFGLQGIRERLKRLNGSIQITSRPGLGTKVVVAIDINSHDEEESA